MLAEVRAVRSIAKLHIEDIPALVAGGLNDWRCGMLRLRQPQPAIMRTHSRACRLSVTPGNNRRSSITAESSPRWRKASRIVVAPASVTENMTGGWACAVAGASRPLARIIGMRTGDDEVALTALSPGFEGAGEGRGHNERRSSPREAVRAHSSFSLGTSSLGTFLRPGRGQSVARVIVCYETSGPVIWPDGHDKTMRHRYDIPRCREVHQITDVSI